MTKIRHEILKDYTLIQEFQVAERMAVNFVRLLLYKKRDPAGTFKLTLKQDTTEIINSTLTSSDINANASFGSDEFRKGMFKFSFSRPIVLQPDVTYKLELTQTGYTFNENDYIGWIKNHEDIINTLNDTVNTDDENPFGFELWGY